MLSLLPLAAVCLASIFGANADADCTTMPPTIPSCTLSNTVSLPTPSGSTNTIYATTVTSQVKAVDCNHCQITNVVETPVTVGPFSSSVTSESLVMTQIACISNPPAVSRRRALPNAVIASGDFHAGDAEALTLDAILKKHSLPMPDTLRYSKRQATTNATDGSMLFTEGRPAVIDQLVTLEYAIGVINSGTDLGNICVRLRSANAVLDLGRVGLNATLAATLICDTFKSDTELASFNQNLSATAAAALYAVQIATNFTGTVDAGKLCSQLELSPLRGFGIDVEAIKDLICSPNNGTNATVSDSTVLATTTVMSTITAVPFPLSKASDGSIAQTGFNITSVVASSGTGPAAPGTITLPTANATTAVGITGTGGPGTGTEPSPTGATLVPIGINGTMSLGGGDGAHATGGLVGSAAPSGATNSPISTSMGGSTPGDCATARPMAGEPTGASAAPSDDVGTGDLEYGQDSPVHVPHGPSSTPGYHHRVF